MATTKKKTQETTKIFVSSSYKDLIPYRQKANESIQRLQQIAIGMELFGSDPDAPLEVCVNRVRECSLLILIVGFRYGSIIEPEGKSITEIEYDTAIEANIPTLVYIIDDDQPVSLNNIDFENTERLRAFKSLLKNRHVVSSFTTPDDLGSKILADVQRELNTSSKEKIIRSDQKSNLPNGEDAIEILKKFILRPMRYDRQEILLTATVTSGFSGWRLNERIISAIGLTIGDTISCDINIGALSSSSQFSILSNSLNRFSIYADGINADWLESKVTHINQEIRIHLRLRAVMVKGLVSHKPDEDTLYVCAIALGDGTLGEEIEK